MVALSLKFKLWSFVNFERDSGRNLAPPHEGFKSRNKYLHGQIHVDHQDQVAKRNGDSDGNGVGGRGGNSDGDHDNP